MSAIDINTLLKEKSEDFKLKLVFGTLADLAEKLLFVISTGLVSRLLNFFEYFSHIRGKERMRIIGTSEYTYLKYLDYDVQVKILNKMFSRENAVCCILTKVLESTDAMVKAFKDLDIPLYYLNGKLALSIKVHGGEEL
jgi:serine kinase of HPr protein (carbohydrate metabolism regulator)